MVLVLVLKKYGLEVLVLVLVLMDRSGIGIGIGIDPKFRYCTSLLLLQGYLNSLFDTSHSRGVFPCQRVLCLFYPVLAFQESQACPPPTRSVPAPTIASLGFLLSHHANFERIPPI